MAYYNETFKLLLEPLQLEAVALRVDLTKEDLERVKTQAREATNRHFSFRCSPSPPSPTPSHHSSVSSLTAPSPALTGGVSRDTYAQDALMLCDDEEEEEGGGGSEEYEEYVSHQLDASIAAFRRRIRHGPFAPGAAVTAEELDEQHALADAAGCPEPAAGNKRGPPPVEGGG